MKHRCDVVLVCAIAFRIAPLPACKPKQFTPLERPVSKQLLGVLPRWARSLPLCLAVYLCRMHKKHLQPLGLSCVCGRACFSFSLSLFGDFYRHTSPSLTQTSSNRSASPALPCPLIGTPCQAQKASSFQAMSRSPSLPGLNPRFWFFVIWPPFSAFGNWVWGIASHQMIRCEPLSMISQTLSLFIRQR